MNMATITLKKERKNHGGPISSSTIHDHKFKFQMKKHTNISSYNDKKELQKLQASNNHSSNCNTCNNSIIQTQCTKIHSRNCK